MMKFDGKMQNNYNQQLQINQETDFWSQEVMNATQFKAENLIIEQPDKFPKMTQSLIITNCFLKTCNGLGFNQNIIHLELVNNDIENIYELGNLHLLKYLDISRNKVSDISQLKNCNQLETLKLANNKLQNIDVINNFSKLIQLDISNNEVLILLPIFSHINFDVMWVSIQNTTQTQDIQTQLWKYIAVMIVRYRSSIKTTQYDVQLTIKDDLELVSLIFLKYLKVTKLYINSCSNVSFQDLPQTLKFLWVCDTPLQSIQGIQNCKSLTNLTLRRDNLVQLQRELFLLLELSSLIYLDIAQNFLVDVSFVSRLSQLQTLNISQNAISSISCLQNLRSLLCLDMSYNSVEDVSYLTSSLRQLNISYNQVKLISCLRSNLVFLNTCHNQITDFSVCSQMTNLVDFRSDLIIQNQSGVVTDKCTQAPLIVQTELCSKQQQTQNDHFKNKYVSKIQNEILTIENEQFDFKCINGLKIKELNLLRCEQIILDKINVIHLSIEHSELKNITGIESNEQVQSLSLRFNQIRCIQPLKDLLNISKLYLGHNVISDIEPLRNLKYLSDLDLKFNKISNLEPLKDLDLISLELESNQINNIHGIKNTCTKLGLKSNLIANLEPLKQMTQLTELNLSNNQIQSLNSLRQLLNLKFLQISQNQINNIDPLKTLTNLSLLDLHLNHISNLQPLRDLILLKDLNLSENTISNIEPLRNLLNLQELRLNKNSITNIEPLRKITGLVVLNLQNNQVENFRAVQQHKNIQKYIID
ncbi:Conserved_hypothetical protein [Hexamita inflata]|uniref:Uncharacterized protein n=1 Tax=Hexamita inflata TaxID=28002 RepID=A0AA86QL60_9EUKA|nr:Conserved hypothetical protein [Hexamita inflata]